MLESDGASVPIQVKSPARSEHKMAVTRPLVLRGGRPLAYSHPHIVSSMPKKGVTLGTDLSRHTEYHVWRYINNATEPAFVSTLLEADLPNRMEATILTEKYVCSVGRLPELYTRFFIHRIEDGAFTDHMDVYTGTGEEGTAQPGDAAYVGSANGLFAVFRVGEGLRGPDTTVEVYVISDDGKFVLKNELRLVSDHPLVVSWYPTLWNTVDLILLTETEFIGSFSLGANHDVHFLRWTSDSSNTQPSHAHFASSNETDDTDFISALKANFNLSSSPLRTLITSHEERYEIDECDPNATIRSVDPTTFKLNWCTSLEQNLLAMGVYKPLGLLVMIGSSRCARYLDLIDLQTGAVRRKERIDEDVRIANGHVTSRGELVTTGYAGEVVVMSLADILARGYKSVLADSTGHLSILRIPCPNPALAVGEVNKDELEVDIRNWVYGTPLFGDGIILMGDRHWIQFVIITWSQL